MKISNSKKQLAKIIHENGGWRDEAQFCAQDKDGEVFHYATKPSIDKGSEVWGHKGCIGYGEFPAKTLPNWHQTVLSRDEYFHLYPVANAAPDADVAPLSVTLDLVTDENKHEHVDSKPSIEQLAADYRNAKDFADRKQQEADAAKADADAKMKALELAGEALGLLVSPITAKQEAELVITDWRDLQEGDVIRCVGDAWDDGFEGSEAVVTGIESHDYKYEHRIRACIGEESD